MGESTFHPSSRGSSYLSLTIKIYDGVYAHKEITEGGKDQKDAMSLLHLGKTLKIGDENFEDLDEVGALYRDFERFICLFHALSFCFAHVTAITKLSTKRKNIL